MFTHFLNLELEYAENRTLTNIFQKIKSFFSNSVSIILPFISIKIEKKVLNLIPLMYIVFCFRFILMTVCVKNMVSLWLKSSFFLHIIIDLISFLPECQK
jgi:hypothetical protein